MRPQVLAHRGASHDHAEHTLGAYLVALEEGADGLECDVRLTADGHLVCVHDRNTKRTTGYGGVVSTMDLAKLSELDFASWKHPWAELDDERPDLDPERDRVLTLRRLLEVVAAQDRRVEIAIETKHPTRYGGLVERKVVELLGEFGWTGADSPARVMSFSYTAIQRIERLAPELPVVQLIERSAMWPMLRRVVRGRWILGPGVELLREHPRLARRLAEGRHDLHVWTVNTAEDLQLCLDLGVKAVISDRPAYLRGLVDALPDDGIDRPEAG
ncbi:glycerophosphodiester phosphodiesterase family protein [Nocardioides sp. GY 10127]|uniref:glycerophosphodiester phosphodiesterase family protein n=1 Tax=Nocardioides sp. GY 10127 TaxID=2569762 RepID=UPI0010A92A75|nr:glycerophosphodiester phosphodiesterase family protein [Nocardioides sp. GY 10127]TIC82713.1 glycerophosphodiester phosphodiesterase [Nocardioides sp. GY 10127]